MSVAWKLGMDDYTSKPFNVDDLKSKLESYERGAVEYIEPIPASEITNTIK